MSGDVHKSGDFYSGHVLLQECASLSRDVYKSREFYSGYVLWVEHSRSVLECPEMCTSPEILLLTYMVGRTL
jgi:hypothetical protein